MTINMSKNGRLYFPIQSEVEEIALEMMDDHHRIYFDPVPLANGLHLLWKDDLGGWEIIVKTKS